MKTTRNYSFLDKICLSIDRVVRALSNNVQTTGSTYPANQTPEAELTEQERKHAAGLMRVNHAGEICAQALYHGQSVFSRASDIQAKMEQAALEEGDHLYWCQKRLDELGSHTSYLNPLWYLGSFCIGMTAGLMGDKWSLGFVAETENQVVKHLKKHMELLPKADLRSYKILLQMEQDESKHQQDALASGAKLLPSLIQQAMGLTSKVMVKTAYWL